MISKTLRVIFIGCIATFVTLTTNSLFARRVLAQASDSQTNTNSQLGCLIGYSDGTFRGDRAMTRYEFAAALAGCLNQIEQGLPNNAGGWATKSDLENLIQKQQQLNQQLLELDGRVEPLTTPKPE
jgi:S-layer homology domain